jgi:hypothetical protein
MKLLELINYFRKGGDFKIFCKEHSLNIDSEVIEIYMRAPFKLENELVFFEIEQTEGMLDFEFNGLIYSNLFDFYFFLDAIDESNNEENKKISDQEIAKNLLNYGLNNA